MRKICNKVCLLCKQKISSVVCATSSNYAFWCAKAISDAKVGLFVPSSGPTNVLEQMERRYVCLIDSRMFISGTKSSFMKSVDWGSMVCNSCRLQSLIAGLMVNTTRSDCATLHDQTVQHHTIRLCNTTRSDCATPHDQTVQHHMIRLCNTTRSECATPHDQTVQHHTIRLCNTTRSECATPYNQNVQNHTEGQKRQEK